MLRKPSGGERAEPLSLPGAVVLALVGLAALGTLGCGGEDALTDTTTAGMVVDFTLSPDPIVAEPLTDDGFEWMATYVVTLNETGGLGGTITAVSLSLRAASGGIEVITDDDPSESTVNADSSRLEAGGTRQLTFVTKYSVPGDGSEALIDFLIQIEDDDGFLFQDGETWTIP